MSWGGPAVGTAPYQPPPFSLDGQPSYPQQQPYQYGQQPGQYQPAPPYPPAGQPQRPPNNGQPKKKGNPVITRYPPPPGYRGPAQPQAPFGSSQYQNQYAPPQPAYSPGYAPPSGFPTPGYQAPPPPNYPPTPSYSPQSYGPPQTHPQVLQPYPAQGYPQNQSYQYPQPSYPPQYPPAQSYQAAPAYPQPTTYPGYPPQPAPVDPNQQAYAPQQSWQPPQTQAAYPSSAPYPPSTAYAQYSGQPPAPPVLGQDPNATLTPTSAYPASGASISVTTEQVEGAELDLTQDDWDFDFDGAIWPKTNEPVDPALSLGVIIWRPAKQVTRALPSTFADAEDQSLKPPAEKLGNGESVSIYFTFENSHEAFLDVRQTDEWYKIRNDPVFIVFPEDKDMDLIPLEECIAKRDRPDEPLRDARDDEDEEMQESSWNVMDNLEQALSGQPADAESVPQDRVQGTESSRDQQQEDILATLGVTGSPKPLTRESVSFPRPALVEEKPSTSLPEKPPAPPVAQIPPHPEHHHQPQRAHSYAGPLNSNHPPPPPRPYGSLSNPTQTRPPPPPPPPNQQEHNPWYPKILTTNGHAYGGPRASPARSEGSNNTLAGSDFDEKPDNEAPDSESAQIPSLHHSDSSSRKRSYEDTDQADDKSRQQDDHTKRKRRSQVDPIYSRR